jgi:hypothetical protein
MQQWEYLEIAVSSEYWVDSSGNVSQLPLVTPQKWKTGSHWSTGLLLNQLGAEGWELTGVVSQDSTYKFVFKRPKVIMDESTPRNIDQQALRSQRVKALRAIQRDRQ